MKKSLTYLGIISALVLFTLTNCSKSDDDKSGAVPTTNNPMEDKVMIGEGDIDAASITVKLYTDEAPFVGYNRLYAMLYTKGTNQLIKNAEVSFMPMMDMGMMQHSCPIENPTETQVADGIYKGAAVFIMESLGMGSWEITVEVKNLDNEQSGSVTLPFEVVREDEARLFSFISETDGKPIFVSLFEPSAPEVGMNTFEIAMHYRENMNSFPAFENAMVKMEPEMPTMGHGSPDNEDPVHIGNGHYEGKVNFTMPGYWKVNLDFKDLNGNVLKNDQFFDITF